MDEEVKKSENNNESASSADKFAELEKKCEEYLNNWKRAAADFINYKKEEIDRMAMLGSYVRESMVLKILPIINSIYLAEKQLPENLKRGEGGSAQAIEWTKGFMQIQNQIQEFLKKEGVDAIETVGQKFNPEIMDIIEEVEGGETGMVVEELQKGYKVGEKILRPAKVKVAK